jgi:hypothetical protein
MLKRILVILVLALTQVSCYISEESGGYTPAELSDQERQGIEWSKRELLKIDDLKIGNGPVAAWGRKISADIEVRYSDGTLIYHGPAIAYFGMRDRVFIHNSVEERGILSLQQDGIIVGLNGMAVGGMRHVIVAPNLVCFQGAIGESTSKGADPNITCDLVAGERTIVRVRKEKLVVEATLTASCIPVFMEIPFIYKGQFRCRNSDIPKRDPNTPLWHVY